MMRPLYALCLLSVFLMVGCGSSDGPVVLARVGGRDLTEADLRAEAARRRELKRVVPAKDVLLSEMVQYEAMLERCRQAGLTDDLAIRREMNNVLIRRYRETELLPRLAALTATDEEIAALYQQNLSEHTKPAKVRLAILFLGTQPGMSDAARQAERERMGEARRQVVENPPKGGRGPAATGFGRLAVDYSDDQASRYRGGDIGWFEPDTYTHRWPRNVLEVGYALNTGEYSDVLETEKGFYLVCKTDAREPGVVPLERVKGAIRQSIITAKRAELETAFRRESLDCAGVEIDREALAEVVIDADPIDLGKLAGDGPPSASGTP